MNAPTPSAEAETAPRGGRGRRVLGLLALAALTVVPALAAPYVGGDAHVWLVMYGFGLPYVATISLVVAAATWVGSRFRRVGRVGWVAVWAAGVLALGGAGWLTLRHLEDRRVVRAEAACSVVIDELEAYREAHGAYPERGEDLAIPWPDGVRYSHVTEDAGGRPCEAFALGIHNRLKPSLLLGGGYRHYHSARGTWITYRPYSAGAD